MGAAAIIGGIGAATQLVGAGMSFAQAKKQKELKAKADAAAAKAMIDAKNKLVTNFSEQQVIRKEPFELAAQANAAVQSQNIDAMRNAGQRALIGGVGRTVAAGDRANQQMRDVYIGKLEEYEKRVADESRAISDTLANIDLKTASGAQKAAAQAEVIRQRNLMQGISALGGAAATGLDAAGLYTGGGLGTNTPDTSGVGNQYTQYIETPKGFEFQYLDTPGGVKPEVTVTDDIFGGNQVDLGNTYDYNFGLGDNLLGDGNLFYPPKKG